MLLGIVVYVNHACFNTVTPSQMATFIEEMPHSDAGGSTYAGQLKNIILFKPNATFFTKCVEMCKWSVFYYFNIINTTIDTKQSLFHTA